ncbi:hypothetical protein C8F04DRAFT_1178000 [Mycena alexandri]|uniref:Uncharacterized protein n=1 Tax=Mycena alexandri TaxID=1745969 RepID=A0AAD6T7D5_9AGAR|nr:hypothetical protein C8F04DRAFT_1178000 [Mycena alexandri]
MSALMTANERGPWKDERVRKTKKEFPLKIHWNSMDDDLLEACKIYESYDETQPKITLHLTVWFEEVGQSVFEGRGMRADTYLPSTANGGKDANRVRETHLCQAPVMYPKMTYVLHWKRESRWTSRLRRLSILRRGKAESTLAGEGKMRFFEMVVVRKKEKVAPSALKDQIDGITQPSHSSFSRGHLGVAWKSFPLISVEIAMDVQRTGGTRLDNQVKVASIGPLLDPVGVMLQRPPPIYTLAWELLAEIMLLTLTPRTGMEFESHYPLSANAKHVLVLCGVCSYWRKVALDYGPGPLSL